MAARRTDETKLRETVKLLEEVYAAGFEPGHGAATEAARRGCERGLFTNDYQVHQWARYAEQRLKLVPDEGLYRQARYQQPVARLQLLPAPPPPSQTPAGEFRHVLAIPDRHRDPRHPHRLLYDTVIARFASDIRFDEIVDLGDAMTFDSVSRHDRNETLRGRGKPSIKADLDHHEEVLAAFERGRAKDYRPKMRRTRGNHEQRLWAFENDHPEDEGSHTHRYEQALLQFGWKERPFGEILYIEGCGFTHAPFNGLGKPMGGKTATHRAGALLTAPLVHGHTHAFEVHNSAKLGLTDRVTVIQAGCALPPGEVEHYAQHSPTGWSYGVVDLWLRDGEIVDVAFRSLERLRDRYSDDGADVAA